MRLSYNEFLQSFPRAPSRTARYGLVVVVSGLTLLFGMLLDQVFGGSPPVILFIIPVAVSAWYGGLRAGMLATLLSGLIYNYFLQEPRGSWSFVHTAADWMRLALFIVIGWVVGWLIESIHIARKRVEADALVAERRGEELAVQLAERARTKAERERLIEELDTERAFLKAIVDEEKQSREALRQSQERLNLAQKAARIGSFEWNVQTNVNIWSEEVEALYGLPRGSFGGTYEAWLKCVHREDRTRAELDVRRALLDGEYSSEWRVIWPDGSIRWLRAQGKVYYDEAGRPLRIFGVNMDITERKRNEAIIDGQRQAFELAVQEVPLGAILEVLTRTVEAQSGDGVLASILLLDSDGVHLWHGAGPSLPESYNRAIDGAAIGPSVGSCGTAAYTGRTTIVSDIARDPLWDEYRELALDHGLRACWSTPIRSSHGEVLGTFALYYREARNPTPRDQEVVDLLTHTAAVVIEREQEGHARVVAERSLREVNRRKDEFLATLAHEMRNSLAPIRNSVQILAKRGDDPGVVAQTNELIDRQIRQMVRLMDDLLDVSRIGQGKISLRKAPVDLADVVATAVETSRPLIEAHRHKLTVSLPEHQVQIEADAARLAQVLSNLLNNAAKYTKEGGRIELSAEQMNEEAVLRVRDNGIGIAPEMLSKVFDMFAQVEGATDRAQDGLGIGLTLARRLVELQGGKVEAHSAGLGKGSEFVVRMPALIEPMAESANKPAEDFTAHAASGSRRILVVDDNADSAKSMAMLLRILGHEVRLAHDGQSALEESRAFRPEVMFLDLGLPEMDGYEVARRLRLEPAMKDITLVAMTGYGQEEDRQRTEEAGFQLHLVKPVEFNKVEELLSSLPESHSLNERGRGAALR